MHYPTVLVTDMKGLAASALRLDAIVDDYPPFLALVNRPTMRYLVTRRWNEDMEAPHCVRVRSVADALDRML
jgi:hypothetical protein